MYSAFHDGESLERPGGLGDHYDEPQEEVVRRGESARRGEGFTSVCGPLLLDIVPG